MLLKKQILKRSLIIFLSIAALIFILPIIFKSYIKDQLVKVYNESQGEYHLVVGDVFVNIFSSGMKLSEVELINSDSASISPLTSMKAKSISIQGVSVFKLIYTKSLQARKLVISSPFIVMSRAKDNKDSLKVEKEEKNSINISNIQIVDPHFAYFTKRSDTLPLFKSDKGLISIREFSVDTIKDSKEFSAYDIKARLEGISYLTVDSMYTVKVSGLQVSYADRSLRIDSFQLVPNYSKKLFGKKNGNQTDRIVLSIPLITSNTFDAKSFVERQMVIADSIEVKSFELNAYRDKNIFSKVEYPLPLQERLKSIDIPISINHLIVLNGDVMYEELREGSDHPGKISFSNIKSDIENISNIHFEDALKVNSKAIFGDKSNFESHLEFPMAKDDNSFFSRGEMGPFPAKALNSMLPFIAGVSATDGYINYLKFNFHATMISSKGYVDMSYKDLKVAVVSAVDGKSQTTGKKIISLLANTFVVKSDVPSKSDPNTKANINYKRDPRRFIFNYSWNSIFNGVKKVVTGKDK